MGPHCTSSNGCQMKEDSCICMPTKQLKKRKKKEIKEAVKDFNYAYLARQNKLHKTLQDKEI